MQQHVSQFMPPGREQSDEQALAPLQIYCFGDFRFYRNGHLVLESEWKRKRARSLCAYFVLRRGQFISRDHLVELFWPELEPEAGLRNFAALLHLLRRVLEPDLHRGQHSRYLLREHEGYRFDPDGELWNDIHAFTRAFERAQEHHRAGQRCRAAQAFLETIRLYQGTYLSNEVYEEWCINPRRHFRDGYIDALVHLADYAAQQEDYRQCIHWLNQGLQEDNCHEELHQRRIEAYRQLSLYNEALRCYHNYCTVMADELDSLPSPQMRAVYEQLRTVCPSAWKEQKPCDGK